MGNKVITYNDIQKIVFSIFNAISIAKRPINFNLIALFLFLKGENITNKIAWRFENNPTISIKECLDQTIADFHINIKGEIAEKIIEIFSSELAKLDKDILTVILDQINLIDNELFQIYSGQIIDDVYQRIAQFTGKKGDTFIQPKEITQLIDSLIELPVDAHVYNPFAGLASYGVGFKHSNIYHGQELNQTIWALGTIRLIAHGIRYDNYLCEDSIYAWKNSYSDYVDFSNIQHKKFDLVVSTPPFLMKLNPVALNGNEINVGTAEDFLMLKGTESVNSDGKFVMVASRGLLTNGGKSAEIRKNIIEKDLLEMVIVLPSGLFEATSISSSILIFNKKKKNPGFVKVVNGESFYIQDRFTKTLQIDDLLNHINSDEKSDFACLISNSQISSNDFSFNPLLYLFKELIVPPGYKSIELGKLISPIKRNSFQNDSKGKLIQISDLANVPFDYETSFSEKDSVELGKGITNKLSYDALIVSRVHSRLKPTYFKYDGENAIYISSNLWAFNVKKEFVDIAFLVNELHSEFVKEQLVAFSSTGVIISINQNEFLKIKILVPPKQIQKEVIAEIRKKIILSKELEVKILREKFEQQTFEEFASLKHALGKPIPGITTALEYIFKYLQENTGNPVSLNSVVSNRRKITLNDKFSVAFNGLDLIRILLKNGESGLILDQYPLMNLKIVQLIRENCESFDTEKFKINIYDENKTIDDIEILANSDLFKILLNDVLSNANNHAFKDYNFEKNEVAVFLSIMDNNLHLNIANNGVPFPSNFNHEKFIQKFQKSDKSEGAGIGGYDINRIADYFNGKFQLITEGTMLEGYNTIYNFNFPLLNAIDNEQYDV